jgi:hypothetical protein
MHHRHGNHPNKFRDRPRVENTRRARLTSNRARPEEKTLTKPLPPGRLQSILQACAPLRRVAIHRERVDSLRCVRRDAAEV